MQVHHERGHARLFVRPKQLALVLDDRASHVDPGVAARIRDVGRYSHGSPVPLARHDVMREGRFVLRNHCESVAPQVRDLPFHAPSPHGGLAPWDPVCVDKRTTLSGNPDARMILLVAVMWQAAPEVSAITGRAMPLVTDARSISPLSWRVACGESPIGAPTCRGWEGDGPLPVPPEPLAYPPRASPQDIGSRLARYSNPLHEVHGLHAVAQARSSCCRAPCRYLLVRSCPCHT